jgi:hypothetical protein
MPLTPVEHDTKLCIISAGGLVGETPASLSDSLRMENDLQYDSTKWGLLCGQLQPVVRKYKAGSQLDCDDLSDCTTVGDVVELVEDTVKP